MSDIPNFTTLDDSVQFYDLFQGKLEERLFLINKVKEAIFPGYDLDRLTAGNIEQIVRITDSVLYDTIDRFQELNPEYKTDNDIFVTRQSVKDSVKEALAEFNTPSETTT